MEEKFIPQFNGRQRQSIGAAHQGKHATLWGEYEVTHRGDRTWCLPYKPNGVHLEPRAVTGEGHPGERPYLSLAERQRRAMDEFAPRPFPAAVMSDDDIIWRNGVGFPRGTTIEVGHSSISRETISFFLRSCISSCVWYGRYPVESTSTLSLPAPQEAPVKITTKGL